MFETVYSKAIYSLSTPLLFYRCSAQNVGNPMLALRASLHIWTTNTLSAMISWMTTMPFLNLLKRIRNGVLKVPSMLFGIVSGSLPFDLHPPCHRHRHLFQKHHCISTRPLQPLSIILAHPPSIIKEKMRSRGFRVIVSPAGERLTPLPFSRTGRVGACPLSCKVFSFPGQD